ncbi:META domain-containing protein [Ornithinimicrobium cavernae]|uniref:META domain-containing protein n=1 Tax=Ornithinimicrobium cavernae TaxID=2666047 RepID=UPI000D693939|nr:META domain-containing protein [Ornithinimicrobium cavernae]
MNRTLLARPARAELRHTRTRRTAGLRLPVVVALGAALLLSSCSVETDPGGWSPPSDGAATSGDEAHTTGDEAPTTGDAGPTTGDTSPTTDAPTASAEDLEGTWALGVSFLDGATDAGDAPGPARLTFRDGTLQVRTGCNQGSASFEVDGDQVSLGALRLTKRACEGTGAAIEALMVGLLDQQELTYAVEGRGLTLTAEDGTALGFHRVTGSDGDSATTTAEPTGAAPTSTATGAAPTGTATATGPAPTGTATATGPAPTGDATATGRATPPAPTQTTTP